MFKLNFDIPQSEKKITLKDQIYLIGSCFSDEIGSLLKENKFSSLNNPFGTLYNPHSICKLIRNESSGNEIIDSQGVFYHWDSHGQVSGLDESEVISSFENALKQSDKALKEVNWLVITLGTGLVYRLKATNEIVANCHKIPSNQFSKELLTTNSIVDDFKKTIDYLKGINPELNILFTVSPVRHVKDGLVENNLSKSRLISAVHELVNNHSHLHYFPSYEIMMDELRDYRFYKKDMIHPSEEAVEYVWKKFSDTYFDQEALSFLSEWQKIKSALHHKPFQPHSDKHQQFLKNTLLQLEKLNDLVDISVEKQMLQEQLK
ncbi:MAG: GSCFA domain-containing protein [Ekhidna sp.]